MVVAVLGVLSTFAIPYLMNALHRGKQKQTMSELRSIATALETYNIDNGTYPNVDGSVAVLLAPLQPTYMRFVPTTDGWAHDMLYAKLDFQADGADYILWSLGRDGQDDGNDGEGGRTTDLDADIVIFDGRFTQWPAGTQR